MESFSYLTGTDSGKVYLWICWIFFLTTSLSYAQSTTVSGVIIEQETKVALPFANVSVLQDSTFIKGTQTDAAGNFSLSLNNNSKYKLIIQFLGYEDTTIEIITTDKEQQLLPPISMGAQSVAIEGVEVVAKKPPLSMVGSKMVMNVAESILSNTGDALEVLGRAPGMSIDATGGLSLRGNNKILIKVDGRETYITGKDVTKFLQTINSNTIDRIEIITNPSAKYESQGVGGIIEIFTIKGKSLGFNGNVKGKVGKGRKWRYDLGAVLNYRPTERTNIYTNYTFFDINVLNLYEERRLLTNPDGSVTRFGVQSEDVYRWDTHDFKIGLDQTVNDRHTIGLQYHLYSDYTDGLRQSRTVITTAEQLDSTIVHTGRDDKPWNQHSANLYHEWQTDTTGGKLVTNVDYALFANETYSDLRSDILLVNGQRENNRINDNDSRIQIMSVKTDYTRPLANGNFGAGIKISRVQSDNEYLSYFNNLEQLKLDENLSNQFVYTEDIYASYVEYRTQWKETKITAGMRAEYSRADGNSVTLDSSFQLNILRFFPNLSLNRSLGKHNLNLSYSRRINRPGYRDVNPFNIYLTDYLFWRGNPQLQPENAHNLEFRHGWNNTFYTTLSLGYTTDAYRVTNANEPESGFLIKGPENFGINTFAGMSFSANFDIIKSFWFTSSQAGIYYSQLEDTRPAQEAAGTIAGISYYYLHSNHSFSLPKSFSVDFTFSYNQSPTSLWAGGSEPVFDVAIRKQFTNGAYITLQGQDIFGPKKITGIYQYQNVDNRNVLSGDWRRIILAFSVPFGKQTVKAAARRSGGIRGEQRRAKTSSN